MTITSGFAHFCCTAGEARSYLRTLSHQSTRDTAADQGNRACTYQRIGASAGKPASGVSGERSASPSGMMLMRLILPVALSTAEQSLPLGELI